MNIRRTVGMRCAVIALFAMLLVSCAEIRPAEEEKEKTVYTAANIWYREKSKILSVNHHAGRILPLGTKVTIEGITGRSILFADTQGAKYRLILARKYSAHEMTTRIFSSNISLPRTPLGRTVHSRC